MNVAKGFFEVSLKDLTAAGFAGLKSKFSEFVATAAGILGGISLVEFAKSVAEAGIEAEKVSARLGAALRLAGDASQESQEKAEKFAASLMFVSTVGDEDVKTVMAEIAAKTGTTGDELNKAAVAAIGLARVYELDLTSAARVLSNVINGKTAALQKYGIVVDETKDKQELLNDFIKKGVDAFRESASETDTYAGKLKQLKEQWGELKETMATGFLRAAGKEGIDTLTAYTTGLSKEVGDAIAMFSGQDNSAWGHLHEAVLSTVLDAIGMGEVLSDNAVTTSTVQLGKAEIEKQKAEALAAINSQEEVKSRAAEKSGPVEKPVDREKARKEEFENFKASFKDFTEEENQHQREAFEMELKIQRLRLQGKDKEADKLQDLMEDQKRIFEVQKMENDAIKDRRDALVEAFQPIIDMEDGMTDWLSQLIDQSADEVRKQFEPIKAAVKQLNDTQKVEAVVAKKMSDPFNVTQRSSNFSSFYNGVGRAIGEFVAAPVDTHAKKQTELLERIEQNTRRRPLVR
jgi:hypothetical protein